ncbi:TIGR01906 family membrane protein [Crassaminicella indica]|uniref:TIGR01906 family membrane protein n=1 Tax=Crassaminicella indica TaxID=2855394 RepID=A0ABX8RBD6_9CLOT|nr:TIGR01906 family membrane protein [Crassaminicella indica]QXM05602.1 TIGR01906 family membrane protein [Crassaminicella indica]
MKKRKCVFKVSQGMIMIFLPIVLLLTILQAYALNKNFYLEEFEKYHVYEATKIKQEDLDRVVDKMIKYLKDNDKDLDIFVKINGKDTEVFGERERLHMVDVKKLFKKGYTLQRVGIFILILSFIVLLKGTKDPYRKIYKSLEWASFLSLSFMIFLFILIQTDFYQYFTYFHKIFFKNDLWILNPKTDRLIQMLPLGFFKDIVIKVVAWFMGIMAFIGVFSFYKKRRIY